MHVVCLVMKAPFQKVGAHMVLYDSIKDILISQNTVLVCFCAKDVRRCMQVIHASGMALMLLFDDIQNFVPNGPSCVMNLLLLPLGFCAILGDAWHLLKN